MTHFELLKYAATGIASPGMTAYDKMRAVAMAGGKVKTLTGVPPLSFKSNGKPLISWSMLGNGQQSGTPAPDAPIMPELVGEKTGNLFNTTWQSGSLGAQGSMIADTNAVRTIAIPCNAETTYTFTPDIDNFESMWVNYYGVTNTRERIDTNGGTFTTPQGCEQIRFRVTKNNIGVEPVLQYNAMLSEGSIGKPYEPYGYKLPITSAGQTTPIYLGQMQTVRRIKKLVLTGNEVYSYVPGSAGPFKIKINGLSAFSEEKCDWLCSHFPSLSYSQWIDSGSSYSAFLSRHRSDTQYYLRFKDTAYSTLADFVAWISEQYAAGTPVCIWYALEEPETGIINEPLAKIGDYADELHSTDAGVTIPTVKGDNMLTVDTDLQPSEMTITYR